MTQARFALDTPTDHPRILSGYNFREVAPETLSPLSWSIIGAGMERGFREVAAAAKVPFPETQPMFVAYLAFRPFHVLTSVDRLLRGLPGISREDPWELLLGGPPPPGSDVEPRSPVRQVVGTARQVLLLRRNGERLGEVAQVVATAEREVVDARCRAGRWGLGAAVEAATRAGRAAWALHVRTTSAMVGSAALLRRALRRHHPPEDVQRLVASAARRRADEVVSSAEPGLLDEHVDHLSCYEVGSLSGRFAAPDGTARATRLADPGSELGGVEVDLLLGSPLGSVHSRLARLLRVCVAEREQSKNLGLRALHCLRLLLEAGLSPLGDDAALLGVTELRDQDLDEQRRLAASRAEEYVQARELAVPVDLRQTPEGYEPIARARSRTRAGRGEPLAPGWAQGRLMDTAAPDGDGSILCGARVDGNDVIALRPSGVVTEVGSLLSHVAIVCRELGIPLVAGVAVGDVDTASTVLVDGWTGTVQVVR